MKQLIALFAAIVTFIPTFLVVRGLREKYHLEKEQNFFGIILLISFVCFLSYMLIISVLMNYVFGE